MVGIHTCNEFSLVPLLLSTTLEETCDAFWKIDNP